MNFLIVIVTLIAISDSKKYIKLHDCLKIIEDEPVDRTKEAVVYFQTVCNETNINSNICQCKEIIRKHQFFDYTFVDVDDQHNLYVERGCPIERPLTEIKTYMYNRNKFLLKNNNRAKTVEDICEFYKGFKNNTWEIQNAELFCDLFNYFENNTNYVFVVKQYKVWFFSSDNEVVPLNKSFVEKDWFLNKR